MSFTKVNGINMYYEIIGQGMPIICISGFGSHHEVWYDFKDELSSQYQLILFDNRGAGQTDVASLPYTIDMMAQDTIALMQSLNISNAHMIGISMGTAIIQTIAYQQPKLLNKAVLISPFPHLPKAYLFHAETVKKFFSIENIPAELLVEIDLPWLFSNAFLRDQEKVQAKISEILNNPYPLKIEGYSGQLAALEIFDMRNHLNKIKQEILLIAGEEDLISPPTCCAQILQQKLPHATLKTFPKIGHMPHVERKEAVIQAIQSFLT